MTPQHEHHHRDDTEEGEGAGGGAVALDRAEDVRGQRQRAGHACGPGRGRRPRRTQPLDERDERGALPQRLRRARKDEDGAACRAVALEEADHEGPRQVRERHRLRVVVAQQVLEVGAALRREQRPKLRRQLIADGRRLGDLRLLIARKHVIERADARHERAELGVAHLLAKPGRDRARLFARVGEDHGRREISAEHAIHARAPVPFAARPRVLPAQLRHVGLDLAGVEPRDLDDRETAQNKADCEHQGRAVGDEAREPARERRVRTTRERGAARSVHPGDERRHGDERHRPGHHHADAADDAELPEAAELRAHERRVGDAGSERGRQRPDARRGDGDDERLVRVVPVSSLLDVPREQHDAEVDAVAYDDCAEKCRVRVERVHAERRQRGEGERIHRREQQRRNEDEHAARPAVVEDDHHDDEHEHDDARDREVGDERVELLDRDGDVAGVPETHPRRVRGGPAERGDVRLDPCEQLLAMRAPRLEAADLDEQRRQVEVSARVAVTLPGAALRELRRVLLLDVAKIEGRRSAFVIERGARLARHLPVAPRLDALADGAEIGGIDVERGVLLEERMLLGGAGADRACELGRIRANASCEVVDEALTGGKPRRIPGVDDDAEVLEPGHARAELVERLNARCIPREQLLEIALEVEIEVGGTPRGRDGEEERGDPDPRAVAQGEVDERARTPAGHGGTARPVAHESPTPMMVSTTAPHTPAATSSIITPRPPGNASRDRAGQGFH